MNYPRARYMNKKLFVPILLCVNMTVATAVSLSKVEPAQANGTEFYCGKTKKGVPVTYARTVDGKKKVMIRWQSTEFGGWTPEKRCVEISRRFQHNYSQGRLGYLASGNVNNKRVICTVRTISELCNNENLLFTLTKGSDPNKIMERAMDIGSLSAATAITQSSGSVNIDLRVYLKTLPVDPN